MSKEIKVGIDISILQQIADSKTTQELNIVWESNPEEHENKHFSGYLKMREEEIEMGINI